MRILHSFIEETGHASHFLLHIKYNVLLNTPVAMTSIVFDQTHVRRCDLPFPSFLFELGLFVLKSDSNG